MILLYFIELPPAPVEIQTFCTVIIWRNAANISNYDVIGYEIQLVNSVSNEREFRFVDASATFYKLDPVNDKYFDFVQVYLIRSI